MSRYLRWAVSLGHSINGLVMLLLQSDWCDIKLAMLCHREALRLCTTSLFT